MTPNMRKNSQHKLIKSRIPKLQLIDDMQGTENFIGQKKRFLEYKNALTFERLPLTMLLKYLNTL